MIVHLDSDFLIYALASDGPERARLLKIADSEDEIKISAIAWYEFSRGPRTPEQLGVARSFFDEDGIVSFTEEIAERSAEIFRQLGCPRSRAADIAIGATAAMMDALLITRNCGDFAGIPDLKVEPA